MSFRCSNIDCPSEAMVHCMASFFLAHAASTPYIDLITSRKVVALFSLFMLLPKSTRYLMM